LERGLVNWNSGAGAGVDDFDLENVLWNLIFMAFFFRNSWEFHHPNWRTPSFFQRSRSTTNQLLILLEVLAIHLCFTEESAEEP
jgi:hypothetical protein